MPDRLNFNIEEIARILRAEPLTFRDDFGSENVRMALRSVADPRLEGTIVLDPNARTLRYRTLLDDFRMTNLIYIGVDDDYARFVSRCDHIQKQLWLNSQGTMIFNRGIYEPPRDPEPQPAQTGITAGQEKEASKRLVLTGAVMAKDHVKGLHIVERKSGKKVLELLIAIKDNGQDKAKWYPLTFFDDRAEEALPYIEKQMKNRQPVTVVVYEREQESKAPSGVTVKKKTYYGADIQSLKKP